MFASTTWRAPLGGALFTGLLMLSGQALVQGQQPAGSGQTPQSVAPAAAGPETAVTVTFDEAVDRVVGTSENITIATAGLSQADASVRQAHSARLPQLLGAASYDRTLRSEFSGLFDSTGPPCTPLQVDPTAPLEDRVTELERAYGCPSGGLFGGSTSTDNSLPFGQANVYRLGLSFSQALYAGGRIAASEEQARLRRDSASLGVTSARAQATLDVAQAYYDAALADRLVSIAEQTYTQADQALQQATAQRDAGRLSEFEQLRARVSRDTLQPDVVRSKANRDVAYLHLKQLLEYPAEQPLALVADLDDPVLPAPARFADRLATLDTPAAAPERVAVTQATQELGVANAGVRAAIGERRPAVSLRSDYGLVAYPNSAPTFRDWRTNWTVGVGVSMPILTGGRLEAGEASARAEVVASQARVKLAKELSALDNDSVRLQLLAAHANWQASGATIEQAGRAYEIADLRFREGLSTQLELSDARLLLARAQVTRAVAARDLQVQRVQFALLPDLPLGGLSVSASGGGVATANTQSAGAAAQATGGQTAATTAAGANRTAAQGGQ